MAAGFDLLKSYLVIATALSNILLSLKTAKI